MLGTTMMLVVMKELGLITINSGERVLLVQDA